MAAFFIRAAAIIAVGTGSATATQAATITGTVVTADAKPVAGATVLIQEVDGGNIVESKPATTDAAGNFTLTASDAPEAAKIRAKYGAALIAYAPGLGVVRTTFKPSEPLRLTLSPERVLRGTVVDAAGKPVAGVPITLVNVSSSSKQEDNIYFFDRRQVRFRVKTNAAGEWELRNVPSKATSVWVSLDDPRFIAVTQILTITDTDAKQPVITAQSASTITGRVVGADGKPVAGVSVSANRTAGNSTFGSFETGGEAVSDAAGAFRIGQLGVGGFKVSVNAKEQGLVAPPATVTVAAGKTAALENPITLSAGALLTGSVVAKKTGKPVPHVIVYANDWGNVTRTGEDGAFKLRVAPGDTVVHIGSTQEGFADSTPTESVTVREGETKVIPPLVLTEAIFVTLKVADETGKPVPNFGVRVWHHDWSDGTTPDDFAKTDANGVWESKNDPRASLSADDKEHWEVFVGSDYEVVSPKTLDLSAKMPIAVVVRKRDIASHPHGRVVTPDGKPIQNATIGMSSWFVDGDGSGQRDYLSENNIMTDADGRFLLAALRPKSLAHLSVQKYNDTTPYRIQKPLLPFTVADDAKQPDFGDIVLVPLNGAVSGTVIGAGGKPVAGAWVWSPDGSSATHTRTNAAGAFTLGTVPKNGDVTVSLARGLSAATYTVTRRAGSRLNLAPNAPPLAPAVRAARNRARAFALAAEIAAQTEPGQGVRGDVYESDVLANMLAPFDIAAALKYGADKNGVVSEAVLDGILTNALRSFPDQARELFEARQGVWAGYRLFWLRAELASVFATRDPAYARQCYAGAARQIGVDISDDSSDETLLVAKLAYLLNAPDADRWEKRALELGAKQGGDPSDALINVAHQLAAGDGTRAAKLIAALPVGKRGEGEVAVLTGMVNDELTASSGNANAQPLEAKRLIDGWAAGGTINGREERWDYLNAAKTFVNIAKLLAPSDPDAAYAVAHSALAQRMHNGSLQWLALLYAASGQTDAKMRVARYREAVAGEDDGNGKFRRYPYALRLARQTGDAAFAAEMRAALTRSVAEDRDVFDINAYDKAFRISALLAADAPDMCRFYTETALRQARDSNPGSAYDLDSQKGAIQAMALIDPERALALAADLHGAKNQMLGRIEVIRILLTPAAKLPALAGDPSY